MPRTSQLNDRTTPDRTYHRLSADCQAVRSGFLRLKRFILDERHSRQATRGGEEGGHARSAVTAVRRRSPAPSVRRSGAGGRRAASSRAQAPSLVLARRLAWLRKGRRAGCRSCEAGELAACFTVHARDLFGYACVVSGADRALAGELVQAAFEAAATVWWTLRGLPADQCRDWLRETLAAAAQSSTGHPCEPRARLPAAPAAHRADDSPVRPGLRRGRGPGPVRRLAAHPRGRLPRGRRRATRARRDRIR